MAAAAVAAAYSGLDLDEDTLEYMGSLVEAEVWADAPALGEALADFVDLNTKERHARAERCFAALPDSCRPAGAAFSPPPRAALAAVDFAAEPEEPEALAPETPEPLSKAQRRLKLQKGKKKPEPKGSGAGDLAPAALADLAALGTAATEESLFAGDGDDAERWQEAQRQGRAWGGAKFGGRGLAFRKNDPTMMTLDVRLSLVTEFGQRDLVTQSELKLQAGRRYALIGKNGAGKTTLLRQLFKRMIPGMPQLRCGYVCQELVGDPNHSALDRLLGVDDTRLLTEERDRLCEGLEDEAQAERYGELCEILEEREQVGREKQAAKQLLKLGFTPELMQRPTSELSGGWRMRSELALALAAKPDLLLLDEPTNHLDLPGVLWLERVLQKQTCIVVCVSHDLAFLDAVGTDVIELRQQRIVQGQGSYSRWREARDDEAKGIQQRFELAEKQRDKIKKEIQQTKQQATSKKGVDDNKLRQMRQRETKLLGRRGDARLRGTSWERKTCGMIGLEAQGGKYKRGPGVTEATAAVDVAALAAGLQEDRVKALKLPAGQTLDGVVLALDEAQIRLPGLPKPLLTKVSLSLACGQRVAVCGPNGAGKTTLLRCLSGELWPGDAPRQQRLRCAVLSQHHLESLEQRLSFTAMQYVREALPAGVALPDQKAHGTPSDQDLRQYLGSVGLGALAAQRLETLSGGQRARLCLAASCAVSPHVLLLDEPTNHLDVDSARCLAQEVRGFGGAVVVVSHDRTFLRDLCTDLWVVQNGRVATSGDFPTAFAEYARRCA